MDEPLTNRKPAYRKDTKMTLVKMCCFDAYDRPAVAHAVPMRFRGILIQRSKLLHPVEHGERIHLDVSLGQPLDDIGITEPEAQIPAHGQADHRRREGMTREGSAGESGERAVAISATIYLCAAPVTTLLDNLLVHNGDRDDVVPVRWGCSSSVRWGCSSSAGYAIPALPTNPLESHPLDLTVPLLSMQHLNQKAEQHSRSAYRSFRDQG